RAIGVAVDKGYLYFGARGKWHIEVVSAGGWTRKTHPIAGAYRIFLSGQHKIKHNTVHAKIVTFGDHAVTVFTFLFFTFLFKAGCIYAGGGGDYPRAHLLTVSRTILVICRNADKNGFVVIAIAAGCRTGLSFEVIGPVLNFRNEYAFIFVTTNYGQHKTRRQYWYAGSTLKAGAIGLLLFQADFGNKLCLVLVIATFVGQVQAVF